MAYFSKKILCLFLCSFHIAHSISLDDIKKFLDDPLVKFALQVTTSIVIPVLVQKYEIFQDTETLAHRKQTWRDEETTNQQTIETNKHKITKMALENEKLAIANAQERLVNIYRSKELIDEYFRYKNTINKSACTIEEKKKIEQIYTHLVVAFGQNFERILEKNQEAISKIDNEYAEYVSQNGAQST